jgi:hypothetical protein
MATNHTSNGHSFRNAQKSRKFPFEFLDSLFNYDRTFQLRRTILNKWITSHKWNNVQILRKSNAECQDWLVQGCTLSSVLGEQTQDA